MSRRDEGGYDEFPVNTRREVITKSTAIFSAEDLIDFKESIVRVGDNANQQLQGRVVSVLYELPLIQTIIGATKIADRLLRALSYPLADISIVVNRQANRLQVGDLFEFSYTPYGVSGMVCRVFSVDEGDLSSETITITAKESIYHVSNTVIIDTETLAGYESGSGSTTLGGSLSVVSEAGIENNITIVIVGVSGGVAGSETTSFDEATNTLTVYIEDGVSTQQNIADAIATDSHVSSVTPDDSTAIWDVGSNTNTADITDAYSGIDYGVVGDTGSTVPNPAETIDPFAFVKVIEAPYRYVGDTVALAVIVSREPGYQTAGYQIYISYDDGGSYTLAQSGSSFSPHGVLIDDYPVDTYQIDDTIGFELYSDDDDMWDIESISREMLFTKQHLALLGDELISFQNIEPHPTINDRFLISGIYRGQYDTRRQTHFAGTDFFFLGESNFSYVQADTIIAGVSVKLKCVPYGTIAGFITEAIELPITITGRAKTPYSPNNLMAGGILENPEYTSDIVLVWDSRIRGIGAGIGLPEVVTDATPEWEGLFGIDVYVSDILVRTTSGIDALTWTYTNAMNVADNTTLADEVTFKLTNYLIDANTTYTSDQVEITVTKE